MSGSGKCAGANYGYEPSGYLLNRRHDNGILGRQGEAMLRHYGTVTAVADAISEAADGAFDAYVEGRVTEEPKITERISYAIEERLKNLNVNGVDWRAYPLRTSSGMAAEEKRHGADLMGVLDINLLDYRAKKGFLVQAKRAEPGRSFWQREWNLLIDQCEKMIARTPDSFVFVYSLSEGIKVFPANAVLGSKSKDIFDLHNHGIWQFFMDHLKCFIGDPRLNSPYIQTLDALADLPVKNVLHITARMSE